jgi:predicted nucleic acid-binding protein
MLAASDTSPISNLAIIDRLNLLQQQFETIQIPVAVHAELIRVPDATALSRIQAAIADGWICVCSVADTEVVELLETGLHRGEAEAIALASQLHAQVLLIDERLGRLAAKRVGMRVTGVLGILARAKRDGRIPAVRPEITALREQAHFFIAASLESTMLESVGE